VPRLVLDASIVVKWLNPREILADKANLIRDDYEQGQISLLVPAFWDYEVVNGINKADGWRIIGLTPHLARTSPGTPMGELFR
jgi:hypothetical protein